eukprot:m.133812 g.133812  ORF g.133812 m.133812 type:complete len:64 (-) comp15958_c0_seq1:2451-2642(-)
MTKMMSDDEIVHEGVIAEFELLPCQRILVIATLVWLPIDTYTPISPVACACKEANSHFADCST